MPCEWVHGTPPGTNYIMTSNQTENQSEKRPFTGEITALATGEASHPDPRLLTPQEREHLGLVEETDE